MEKKQVNLHFYIDVSGVPYNTTFVGVIVSTPQIIDKSLKALKQQKNLFSKKAKELNHEELLKVLKVFDSKGLKMITTKFNSSDWEQFQQDYGKEKEFKEKIMGYIYYELMLEQQMYKNFPYFVTTCTEDHLKIDSVHNYARILAKSDKRQIDFSKGNGNNNSGLKLVDYVAQSYRKIKYKKLKQLNNLKCKKIQKNERYFKKLFD
ncbi:MAG: hypothetical protein PHQ98_03950 [Candidatus ainarchaeum sp.]|nr:hypothetical protein [Candidatus ainarchaeum sp.]